MKKIYAVCDGIFGLNVFTVVNDINRYWTNTRDKKIYEFCGYICDDPSWLFNRGLGELYKGNLSSWKPTSDSVVGLGVREPDIKEKTVVTLLSEGAVIESLISPYSIIPWDLKVGKGALITAKTSIKDTSVLHDYVSVIGAMVGSYAEIGDYCTLLPLTNLTNSKLGKGVLMGRNTVIPFSSKGIKVGDYAVASSGSVLVRNIRDHSIVVGNPAKQIGKKL